jgi:cytoskeletal protein RodZ
MRKISEILKESRLKKDLSLADVEKDIKIKKQFLEYLEHGEFKKLPSESYALGFVKNYASYLGLSSTTAAALFRRENERVKVDIMPSYKKKTHTASRKLFLRSPKGFFILGTILIVASYLVFQFSFLFVGPKLSISTPKNGSIVKSNVVEVKGETDPYATVTVNGEEVYVDLTGSFRKTLYVYSGDSEIVVISQNRYGKESKKNIQVKVE